MKSHSHRSRSQKVSPQKRLLFSANETEAKVPLKALSSLTPETYEFKFRGSVMINDKPFEQDSPTVKVKIIH